jgi:ribosomal protein S18 acetylase RimI-like enzyme
MHIDILPEWQGSGWGRKLIESLFESVKKQPVEGRKGLWLGIAGDNAKVVKFYERMGLTVWPKEGWKEGDGIRMTKDL